MPYRNEYEWRINHVFTTCFDRVYNESFTCHAYTRRDALMKLAGALFCDPKIVSLKILDCVIIGPDSLWEDALNNAHPPQ